MAACYYRTADGGVWTHWTTDSCTTATAGVWYDWNQTSTNGYGYVTNTTNVTTAWYDWSRAQELTKEQRDRIAAERERIAAEQARAAAEWEAGRPERERKEAERKKAEQEANRRAEELLTSQLNTEQKQEYAKDHSFTVRCRQGRRYRIRRAWSGHVSRIDDAGKEVERFCIHPREAVPLPDNQLFAKLLLEHDPEHFLKTANRHPVPAGAN